MYKTAHSPPLKILDTQSFSARRRYSHEPSKVRSRPAIEISEVRREWHLGFAEERKFISMMTGRQALLAMYPGEMTGQETGRGEKTNYIPDENLAARLWQCGPVGRCR